LSTVAVVVGMVRKHTEERPSELSQLDEDLVGVGAERTGARAGRMVRHYER
jgi:hypothetical protein